VSYPIRGMSFAEILDTGFRMLRDHFVVLVGLAAIVGLPEAILDVLADPKPTQPASGIMSVISTFLQSWSSVVSSVVITFVIGELYVGRRVSAGRSLRSLLGVACPVSATAALYATGVLLGLALFLIPGMLLMLSWFLVSQVMVLERRYGYAALQRSSELMRGSRGRLAGVLFAAWLTMMLVSSALQDTLGVIPALGPLGGWLGERVGFAYLSVVEVVLYFDIRCRNEAFDLEHLARLVEMAPSGPSAGQLA
jgi:hypothetical protein